MWGWVCWVSMFTQTLPFLLCFNDSVISLRKRTPLWSILTPALSHSMLLGQEIHPQSAQFTCITSATKNSAFTLRLLAGERLRWLPLRKASLSTSRKPPTIIKPHRRYSKHASPSQTVPAVEKINMKEHKLFSSPQEKHFLSARSLSQMN